MLYHAVIGRVSSDPTLTEEEKETILSFSDIDEEELLVLIKLASVNGNNPYVVSVTAYED
jgi:hypothetical protein